MISTAHVQLLARYNTWQNLSLYAAAETLSDADRRADRLAFWSSIHGTLNHILWGDQIWMSRFADLPAPAARNQPNSTCDLSTWNGLRQARSEFDGIIEDWANGLTAEWLASDLTWYSGAAKSDVTKPTWVLVTHFFNHQTHHRGQVHCMLTQCGARPDDTDLFLMRD